ncbi:MULTISPECIES: hypothetical protein [Xanthomonas]|uniref:hypothetical protein n=1 Tax=Xanthomonas TaxID=338 RepID=UPI0011AFDD82|nr:MULTISPECIES: hypothetical protein [Xanthomonas]
MLTAVKSGVKFLTESEAERAFHHTSACFYSFFDNSLENSDLGHVLRDISKLNAHVRSRQKSPLAGRQQAWLRKTARRTGQESDQRSPRRPLSPSWCRTRAVLPAPLRQETDVSAPSRRHVSDH